MNASGMDNGQVAGGARTGERNLQLVESPWPLDLARKWSPDKKPRTIICQYLEENTGSRSEDTSDMDGPAMGKPPGDERDLVTGLGHKRGIKRTQ